MPSKISGFNKQNIRQLQNELESAIKKICRQYELDVEMDGGVFNDTTASLKFKITVPNSDGTKRNPLIEDFKKYASVYGLDPTDLGREFDSGTSRYTIIGLKPQNRDYPIIVRGARGGEFKFRASDVRTALGKTSKMTPLQITRLDTK